jgi:hypothetical protein
MAEVITGVIAGPVREPRNRSANVAGSIHDDVTATALGFRGGTVAGSIHMDQFPPLLLEAFGPAWFETGTLSLYFRHATTDGEPVQAFVERPGAGASQVRAWMTTPDGTLVAEGTASAGASAAPTALRSRDLRPEDPAGMRILSGLAPGDSLGDLELTAGSAHQQAVISAGAMTEPLDWYTGASPWGGPIASPSAVVSLLYRELLAGARAAMGEHVSQTPKTEVLWFDSVARDDAGQPAAAMRMMLRQLKASSPRYGS